MRYMRTILLVLVAVGLPLLASAGDFAVPPTPSHFVTDQVSALSDGTKAKLEDELRAYEKTTGNQIIVFIAATTGAVPLEDWTAQTAHTWKVGHAKKDNGAVLFLFTRDHHVRIEVGYGLEGQLTDADSKRIIDTYIVPEMKAQNVDAAVSGGVNAMLLQVTPTYKGAATPEPAASADELPDWAAALIILVLFMLFVVGPIVLIAILVSRSRHQKFGTAFHNAWFWSPGSGTSSDNESHESSSESSSGSDSSDFSAGGGDFGGGGASGSW